MQIIYTDKHKLHDTSNVTLWSFGGPVNIEETPARAEIIKAALLDAGLGELHNPEDHGIEPILKVHSADYVDYLKSAYQKSLDFFKNQSPVFPEVFPIRPIGKDTLKHILSIKGYYSLDTYSPILQGTWEAAYWSAQCALTGANLLRKGEQQVYALCRPPGHHAASDYCAGFCYLNNTAIAARALQPFGRVAILDIDYHVANGTQSIFYSDPNVLVCSLHGHPRVTFPYYWGYADEQGEGPGTGYHSNFPIEPGADLRTYLGYLEEALKTIQTFKPAHLILSLGLDIVADDPVGGFKLQPSEFTQVAESVARLNIPTLLIQEGGYLENQLAPCITSFIKGFLEK